MSMAIPPECAMPKDAAVVPNHERPFPTGEGKAFWHYPLPEGPVADRYISGPLPDGDQNALIEMDPSVTPWAPPYKMTQLPKTIAGTMQGRMQQCPYPRVLGWFSMNLDNEMDLGGTVTVYLGEALEQHSFDAPTLVYIPPNVPHGVVVYGPDIRREILHLDTCPEGRTGPVELRPDLDVLLPDLREGFPSKAGNPESYPITDADGEHLDLPDFIADAPDIDPLTGEKRKAGAVDIRFADPRYPWHPAGGGDYGKYFFSGRKKNPSSYLPATQVRLLPGDIPGVPIEKQFLFVFSSEDDKRHNNRPMHLPHAHPFTESLVWVSMDPSQPHDLGCTVKIYAFDTVSKKLLPNELTKPFVSCNARGKHLHCPLIKKDMTRKVGFMWYCTDYDARAFKKGPKYGTAMQLHNAFYTNGLFNLEEYGVLPEDLPADHEGDGGYMTKLEPHLGWPASVGHDGVNAPKLKKPVPPHLA
ncbi:MAG: hypothetical protein QHC40_04280 [Sphingobium sp.]|nr:hypothetical protein [Sphingobium sp.]